MHGRVTTLAFILFLFLTPLAQTQTQNEMVTLRGVVGEATQLSNGDLHVWLQSAAGGSEVCLGSARFLADQSLLPGVGDSIEITGARTQKGSLLVANSLQIRGKTLALSGAKGTADCPGCTGHASGEHNCGHHNCGGHCADYGHHEDHE
jgi:hypothetical protein